MAAGDRPFVFQKPQIAAEATAAPGVQVTPNRQLGSMEIAPGFNPDVQVFSPMGYLLATVAATNREWTVFQLKGQGVYDELIYFFVSLLIDATPTTPGGGTVTRLWDLLLNTSSLNTTRTFTEESGDTIRASRFGYMQIVDGQLAIDLEKGLQISGSGIGQKMTDDKYRYLATSGSPTGGTVTLTLTKSDAITTSLAYNANAAAIQAALRALPTIGAAGVTVTGSGPFTVTFAGELGNKNVPLITLEANALTGGTNPGVTIVETTPGVDGTSAEVQTVTITGSPTGGTFVLGFKTNSTTSPAIAYNAAASAVQTALESMPLIAASGADVSVSGGPLGTAPIAILFVASGAYGAIEPPSIAVSNALTGGTSPSAAMTRLAPGATALPLVPILGSQFDYYIALSHAGLATATALTRLFNYTWKFGPHKSPIWAMNTGNAGTFADTVEVKPAATVGFSVGADSTGMALLQNLRNNDTIHLRAKATGPIIEGSLRYYLIIDTALKLTKISPIKDGGGLVQIDYEATIVNDSTWGYGLEVQLQNTIASL